MLGKREMPEDCRNLYEVPYPVQKFKEGFLEEEIFELGSRTRGGEPEGSASGAEGQRKKRPTMDGLCAQLHM